VNNSI